MYWRFLIIGRCFLTYGQIQPITGLNLVSALGILNYKALIGQES